MSTTQAAEHFGVHVKTIFRWLKAEKIKAEKVDGEWCIYVDGHYAPDNAQDNALSNAPGHVQDNAPDIVQSIKAQLERADSEIQHLRESLQHHRDQLQEKDRQIESLTTALDHAQQLLAMQTKNSAELTAQLDAQRQLEDLRNQQKPWWKRIFS